MQTLCCRANRLEDLVGRVEALARVPLRVLLGADMAAQPEQGDGPRRGARVRLNRGTGEPRSSGSRCPLGSILPHLSAALIEVVILGRKRSPPASAGVNQSLIERQCFKAPCRAPRPSGPAVPESRGLEEAWAGEGLGGLEEPFPRVQCCSDRRGACRCAVLFTLRRWPPARLLPPRRGED
ncbi:hypothetical protein AAFF_G00165010 [Aldrovandia affinis]|uniref:Uncharacterized protein n=1 Tax=Aldrovandia affinis TaxID=143900 RepID=A0AAD7RMI8_9TELE|nr:hypothetical protein AAFF_G00165010 [Aldrovandia affinis]